MTARNDIRRLSLLLVMAIVVVAVVVPTCQMVGCTMAAMPGMPAMSFFGGHDVTMSAPCDGSYVINSSPLGVIPAGLGSLVLVLLAALVVAVSPLFVSFASQLEVVEVAEPPPQLGSLGGVLLRV